MHRLNHKKAIVSAVLIAVIVVISILFHYSIHIADALTLENMPDYGIHISGWRILFEPFLGILLFFNRSLYALTEFQMILFWILPVYIVYSVIKSVSLNDKRQKKRFIYDQLANVPIVISLWFALLIIMIFLPLPNNTIINHDPDSVLVTTHSHTVYSHDGLISDDAMWKWQKQNGFDAFFITDHANHNKTLDFVKSQRNRQFPEEPLVMGGEEYSGSNHLSLLGLKTKFSTKGMADSTVINLTHAQGGAVIVNHWFDGENKSLEYYKNLGVDGFEIENTATDKSYDRKVYQRIKDFCEQNNLIMNGGLDFHGYGNVCSLWNAFEIPGWHTLDPDAREAAILRVIKTRDQNKLRVLLYKDRPYYTKKHLIFSPLFTSINYFRTLNLYQVLSWIFWIVLFAVIRNRFSKSAEIKKRFAAQRLIPVLGILSALIMLQLGLLYLVKIQEITDFTKMFREYSVLLLSSGSFFLLYAGMLAFIRKRRALKG